jgi:SNF2 family DNA or RNA helicase
MTEQENKYDGGMLLSDAGVGKSINIISMVIKNPVPTLIICPAGIIDNWCNEVKKHTNISNLKVLKYYGPDRQKYSQIIGKQLIYITSYSIITREFNNGKFDKNSLMNLINFGRIVLDEAHYIRNVKSTVHKSIIYLGDKFNVKKWIVTATPIFNGVKDAYGYFKFLQLEGIDTRSDWRKAISKNLQSMQLLNKWFDKYGIALKKTDVLKFELKEKNEMKIILKFNDIDDNFYNALKDYSLVRMKLLVKRMKKITKETDKDMKKLLHSHVMTYILRLKQACNSQWLILGHMERLKYTTNIKEATEILNYFNVSKNLIEECSICYDTVANYIADPCGHKCCKGCWDKMQNMNIINCPICRNYVDDILPISEEIEVEVETEVETAINIQELKTSTKIKYLIELVKKVIAKKEKIIIVSQWVSMLNLIRDVFKYELKNVKHISLQGNVNMKDRTELIKNFQENSDIEVCFISLMSSAEGINITAANHLLLLDLWWNESKTEQMAARIDRIGQNKVANIYHLQIQNSIEEKIEKLINKKSKVTKLVLNKWTIKDNSNYDASWINDVIQLIEKPDTEAAEN